MLHPACAALKGRAEAVLAGGPGTFSKHASRYPEGLAPYALVSGEGAYVTGSNGETYLDTVAALGANLLGYTQPEITLAVTQQVIEGASFSMLHPLEVAVGEQLCRMLPCAEQVRWARNGTDATIMAARLARAITGHKHIVWAGYHGGGNPDYGITTEKAAGILATIAPYNHQVTWDTVESIPAHVWGDLACIVTEVPALAWETPASHYSNMLAKMQAQAHGCDALFVLDEVVTFPRFGTSGAQGLYGVTPDLACVSKGIANGWPLAALVGKRQYMERFNVGDIFASWTFAGETTALAAAQETLRIVQETDAIATLQRHGEAVGTGLRDLFKDYALPATVYGHPARIAVKWRDVPEATAAELRTLWLAEMARRGVLLGIGVLFPMAAWQPSDVALILDSAASVCEVMTQAIARGRVAAALPCPVMTDVLSVRA
jgi:glutamate-1-semialdehyde aminotransferase